MRIIKTNKLLIHQQVSSSSSSSLRKLKTVDVKHNSITSTRNPLPQQNDNNFTMRKNSKLPRNKIMIIQKTSSAAAFFTAFTVNNSQTTTNQGWIIRQVKDNAAGY